MGSIYANKPNTWKSAHSFDHAGYQAIFDAYGTVIFDATGRISGGGAAADSLFGAGQGRIIGRLISVFIPDIRCDADWHGQPTKFLITLCESAGWHQVEALDIFERGFIVAIRVFQRMTNRQQVYVLNFHRPGIELFA